MGKRGNRKLGLEDETPEDVDRPGSRSERHLGGFRFRVLRTPRARRKLDGKRGPEFRAEPVPAADRDVAQVAEVPGLELRALLLDVLVVARDERDERREDELIADRIVGEESDSPVDRPDLIVSGWDLADEPLVGADSNLVLVDVLKGKVERELPR